MSSEIVDWGGGRTGILKSKIVVYLRTSVHDFEACHNKIQMKYLNTVLYF